MKALTLRATAAYGVEIVDIVDYPEAVMMTPKDFLSDLNTLDDDEEVFTQLMPSGTDGDYEMIDSEYGIKQA